MITHIVFFRLSDRTDRAIAETLEKLLSMDGKIPQIRQLEAGADIVRSERSYDLALITRFDSMDDLQAYQVHPYHAEQIVPFVRSICSSIVAVDYETGAMDPSNAG